MRDLKIQKFALFFLCVAIVISACTEMDIRKAMADFDKSYIPVLYHISKNDLPEAKKSLDVLEKKAAELEQKFAFGISTEDRRESLRMTKAWLEETACAIDESDVFKSRVQIDHVRYELMDLRYRENIDYFLDYVWDFEATLDVAVCTAEDLMLCLYDWPEFERQVQDVEDAWITVLQNAPGEELTGGDQELLNAFHENKLAVDEAVKDFGKAVDCAGAEAFSKAAGRLWDRYLDYIAVFGDFETPDDNIVFTGD